MAASLEWAALGMKTGAPVLTAMVGAVAGATGFGTRRTATTIAVNFAAGAFLAVAVLHLLPEAASNAGWLLAVLAAAAGGALCAGLARWAGGFCPACMSGHSAGAAAPNEAAGLDSTLQLGIPLVLVLALHSAFDGLALVGSGADHQADLVSLAVLIHKLPEGLAIAAVCRSTGMSVAGSLGLTAAVQSCTLLGLLGGLAGGALGGPVLGLGLGVVAGSFLYLAILTFSGERASSHRGLDAGTALAGSLVVVLARVFLGGGH